MHEAPPWSTSVVTPHCDADHVGRQAEAAGDVGVDVRVGVDHARQHDAGRATSMVSRAVPGRFLRDRGDAAIRDGDVGDAVEAGAPDR